MKDTRAVKLLVLAKILGTQRFNTKNLTEEIAQECGYKTLATLKQSIYAEARKTVRTILRNISQGEYEWYTSFWKEEKPKNREIDESVDLPEENEMISLIKDATQRELSLLQLLDKAIPVEVREKTRFRLPTNILPLPEEKVTEFFLWLEGYGLVNKRQKETKKHTQDPNKLDYVWELNMENYAILHDLFTERLNEHRFERVLEIRQNGETFYSFALTGEQIAKFGRVKHFAQEEDGVNRQIKTPHVKKIIAAMVKNDTFWCDSFVVSPRGLFEFRDGKFYYDPESFCFIVDDGQHRLKALQSKAPGIEHMADYEFPVICSSLLPIEDRLDLFMNQNKRKRIDPTEELAVKDETKKWANENERIAYEIIKELNNDRNSPLFQKIYLIQRGNRKAHERNAHTWFKAKNLHSAIKRALGSSESTLYVINTEAEKKRIIIAIIKAAYEVWKDSWGAENMALGKQQKTIEAILRVVADGKNFPKILHIDKFTYKEFVRTFQNAADFDWSEKKISEIGVGKSIALHLDKCLWDKHRKQPRRS